MKNVRFSRKARRDLNSVYTYVAQDNVSAAETIVEKLYRICTLLSTNPKLGRPRPEPGAEIRYIPVSNLNVFYTLKRGDILNVRIIHGRRDIWRALYE